MIISNIDNKDYERKAKDFIENQEKVKKAYRLLSESQGGYLDHDQKMAMLQAERNIESAKEIEIFYCMYGRHIEIPCTNKFTMYIEPALGGDSTCIRAEFVMTSETEAFLYDHVYNSHSMLHNWFTELLGDLLFAYADMPNIDRIRLDDIEKIDAYFQSDKMKRLFSLVDQYIDGFIESQKQYIVAPDD